MAERRPSLLHLLGQMLTVVIDRPIGSRHPEHPEMIYPLHYGYIPHLMGGDGEPQDAYLMGVSQPVTSYTGQVVGIVRRINDREDKLVLAPAGMRPHQAEIARAVHFQEQYFRTRIIPLYHRSAGAIVYRKSREGIRYLLLFQRGSHTWSFPKGHIEREEDEQTAALREVREEISMQVKLLPDFYGEATYPVGAGEKTVALFLAKAVGTPKLSTHEVLTCKWLSLSEAEKLLHSSYIAVLRQAEAYLLHHLHQPI